MGRPICSASSTSVGGRPCLASSSLRASSILVALDRTRRGTQSIVRSSSSMAPRMRGTQYVSNLTPRPRSNASIASIRPKTPAEIRSSRSTPSGRRCQIRSALYLTRGKYRSTSWFRISVVGCSLNSRQSSVTSTSTLVDILTSVSAEREDSHPCVEDERAIHRALARDLEVLSRRPGLAPIPGFRDVAPACPFPPPFKELDPKLVSDNPTNRLERYHHTSPKESTLMPSLPSLAWTSLKN